MSEFSWPSGFPEDMDTVMVVVIVSLMALSMLAIYTLLRVWWMLWKNEHGPKPGGSV